MRSSSQHLANADFRVRATARQTMLRAASAPAVSEDGEFIGRAKPSAALGREALAYAAATLECADWAGRRGAARALHEFGDAYLGAEGQEAALQTLQPRLRHTDWSIRRKAV